MTSNIYVEIIGVLFATVWGATNNYETQAESTMQNIHFASVTANTLGSRSGVGAGGAGFSFVVNEAVGFKPLEKKGSDSDAGSNSLEEP